MKNNKKLLIVLGVIALLAVVTIGIYKNRQQKIDNVIRIGLLLAQTGFGSDFGQSEKSLLPLLSQAYGENVQFVLEDSKSDALKGVIAARKLLDVDKVDMIYCDLTSVASAISPLVKREQKVLMAAVYLDTLIKENPFAIRNIPSALEESKLLFQFFSETHPGGTILLLGSDNEFGRGAVSASKSLIDSFGLVLAGSDTIPEELSLIASCAAKIVSIAPDGVYIGSMSSSMGLLVKELRSQGYAGTILTTDAFSYDYILNYAGEFASSVVYVDFPKTKAFQEMTTKIDGHSVTPAAVLMYDGIRMYLDKIMPMMSTNSDFSLNDISCRIDGIFGDTTLIHQEIKYPLILMNANR